MIGRDYLLFDGDCGICQYLAGKAGEMDVDQRFIIEPYQTFPEDELKKAGITPQQCERALQVITRKGRVYQGAFGINYFLWQRFLWSLLVVLIYAVPVLLLFEIIGYRLVANNRHRLSRWLGMKACSIKR